jgi:nicotinamide mononucleotide transporter
MIEAAGIIASLMGVYFSSQRKPTAWIWNMLASCLYIFIFYQAGLYSDMELQLVFILMSAYGLYQWQQAEAEWKPTKNSLAQNILGIMIALLYGLVAGFLHERFTTQVKNPYWDACLAGLSILGTFWAAQRKIENWILWILVDIAYVGMYIVNGLHGTAALYAIYIILAIYGWTSWYKKL